MSDLKHLIDEAKAAFATIGDIPALENAKAKYLGKTGALTEALKGLGKLSAEERPSAGAAINAVKQAIEAGTQCKTRCYFRCSSKLSN